MVRLPAKQDEQKSHQGVDRQYVARPKQVSVKKADDEQPEEAALEERGRGQPALSGALNLEREPEAEQEREDRVELSFYKEVYEKTRELVGEGRLLLKGWGHHAVA